MIASILSATRCIGRQTTKPARTQSSACSSKPVCKHHGPEHKYKRQTRCLPHHSLSKRQCHGKPKHNSKPKRERRRKRKRNPQYKHLPPSRTANSTRNRKSTRLNSRH